MFRALIVGCGREALCELVGRRTTVASRQGKRLPGERQKNVAFVERNDKIRPDVVRDASVLCFEVEGDENLEINGVLGDTPTCIAGPPTGASRLFPPSTKSSSASDRRRLPKHP